MSDTYFAMSTCTAFAGGRQIASGTISAVALKIKEVLDPQEQSSVLIFDDDTSQLVEIDFCGTTEEVLGRLAAAEEPVRKPGRPRLGVTAREVTLLPRHWEWLASQSGGASVALRKLVEAAMKANQVHDRVRLARESAYRFLSAMAGNEAGFEEATRALFAGDRERFRQETATWPADIRAHAFKLFDNTSVPVSQ